jgi:hypothetical protein
MKKNFLVLFVLLFILGCDGEQLLSPGQSAQKLDTVFELKVGQSAVISSEQISFKFDSVPADSRCPMNAICVWEGNAVVALSFGDSKTVINTSIDPKEFVYGNYKIKLVSLQPYPSLPDEILPDAYVARFIVSKITYFPL